MPTATGRICIGRPGVPHLLAAFFVDKWGRLGGRCGEHNISSISFRTRHGRGAAELARRMARQRNRATPYRHIQVRRNFNRVVCETSRTIFKYSARSFPRITSQVPGTPSGDVFMAKCSVPCAELGIAFGSSVSDIERAWRKRILVVHPDKGAALKSEVDAPIRHTHKSQMHDCIL